jgi:uncharacterized protein
MPKVPEATKSAAISVARKLRERAGNLRPDEELAASIAVNAVLGDEYGRAYGALRELGLQDRVLDRFGLENATAAEIREAAELLEQLARSAHAPGRRKRGGGERAIGAKELKEYRVAAIVVLFVVGLPMLAFACAMAYGGLLAGRGWWLDRDSAHAVAAYQKSHRAPAAPAAPERELGPVNSGFVRTQSNLLVPAKPRDHFTDRAGIFDAKTARTLNARLVQFERETSNQFLIFVDQALPPDTPMEELTAASLQHWGVGQKGKDNGVVFFAFIDDRKMRIEVGYGLEGVLTDARARRITSQIIRPMFQQGRFAEGVDAGARAIMDVTREGDAALDLAVLSTQSHATLAPVFFWMFGTVVFFSVFLFILRSVVLFLQGRGVGLFRTPIGRGSGSSAGSSSSGSGGGSSSSGGSFSSGGGSGGGGGASDSW